MKFTANLAALANTVSKVSRAVAVRTPRSQLANLFVNAKDGMLKIAGTDLEIMMLASLEANVEVPGYFTVSAKLLQELLPSVSHTDEPEINFEIIQENSEYSDGYVASALCVKCGRSKFNLLLQDASDYPPIPVLDDGNMSFVEFPTGAFLQSLIEASIAMNTTDMSAVQKSICLDLGDLAAPKMAATDSKRLSITNITGFQLPEEFKRRFLLPARVVPELKDLLSDNETLKIAMYNKQLVFTSENFTLITSLIEGIFPDYVNVVPKNPTRTVVFERAALARGLKLIVPIARNVNDMVHLEVEAEETKIWTLDRETGRAESYVQSNLTGDPIHIAFNAKFIMDYLNVAESDEIAMEMTAPNYPVLLRQAEGEARFFYVLMPLTI